jgi:hypothetical protein
MYHCSINPPGSVIPVSLTCEYGRNPLGIESQNPKLSWKLVSDHKNQVQNAYQILVASSNELLAEDKGDVWKANRFIFNIKAASWFQANLIIGKSGSGTRSCRHQTGVNRDSGKWDCWILLTGRQHGLLIIVMEHPFSERHSIYQEKPGRPAFTYAASVILNFA